MSEKPRENFQVRLERIIFSGVGVFLLCGLLMWLGWELGQGRCSFNAYVEPYRWHCKGKPIYYLYERASTRSPDQKYWVAVYSHGEEIVVEVREAIGDSQGNLLYQHTYTHYANTFVTNTPVTWKDNSQEFSFDYDFTYKDVLTECLFTYNIPNDKFVLTCTNP